MRLNVYSIERSLHFYQDLLGFQLIGKPSVDNAILSTIGSNNKDYLLQLSRVDTPHRVIEGEHSAIRQAGLYHFAILLPSRRHLANVFKHLTENSNELFFEGAADHLVSESLYLRDPTLMVSRFTGIEISRSGKEPANFRWR